MWKWLIGPAIVVLLLLAGGVAYYVRGLRKRKKDTKVRDTMYPLW